MAQSTGEQTDGTSSANTSGAPDAPADAMGQSFAAALEAVGSSPASVDAWAHLEELADSLQRPDEVAQAYRDVLDTDLSPEQWSTLSARAAQFHEEWFGDSPDDMLAVLRKILDKDASAQWAFERLTMVLTVAERWDDLLDQYDRALQRTSEPKARARLLDDAAHTAKDFAKKPGRAVDYMQLQLEQDSGNHKLAGNIERLLERQNRWEDLIELWQNRLPELTAPEARRTRLRVAQTFLDHLEAAAPAVEELRRLVEEAPGHPEACAELEKVLRNDGVGEPVRLEALSLLRSNYRAADRPQEIVEALKTALGFAQGPQRLTLLREAGSRSAILGHDADALGHYTALLLDEPSDADARRQLRQLALRSEAHTQHADALVAAAEAVSSDSDQVAALLLEAAAIAKTRLEDSGRAIDLFHRVVALSGVDATLSLKAAHQLNELLAATGRTPERIDVLERLATLETAPVVRRAVLGEVGRLCDEQDDPDRALAAYGARLDADATDFEALDATIEVLQRRARWQPLCDALLRRANATGTPQQRRADLATLAKIQETELEAIGDAISTWQTVRTEFGDEPETVAALDQLMSNAMRFPELAEILDHAAGTRRLGAAGLLSRLGEVQREELTNVSEASKSHAEALAVDPHESTARAGLGALLEHPEVAATAAEALARAYRDTDDWQALVGLMDVRVATATDPFAAVEVLREAARLHEHHGSDAAAAQAAIARALVADPEAAALEAELLRLAELSEDWEAAAATLHEAGNGAGAPVRAAALFRREASVRQDHLGDAAGAVEALGLAAAAQPDDLPIQRAIIEASARAGTWTAAVEAAMGICRARELLDEDVLAGLAQAADVTDGWEPLLGALDEALSDVSGLPTAVARDLYAQVARWHLDNRDDLSAAETSARNALGFAAGHRPTLEFLADLQRRLPEAAQGDEPPLSLTLLEIDALSDRDLDALTEAAEVATTATAGADFRRRLLARLYRKAARLLAAAEAVMGERDPKEVVVWALEQLVALDVAADRTDDAIKALIAAAQMPLPSGEVAELRRRAAQLCTETGKQARAIDLYRRVLEERPDDLELVRALAALCAAEDRTLELLEVRNQELQLTEDPVRKLELRLELSGLVATVEQRSGRVESLHANLAEQPGHRATLEALTEVLTDRGRQEELARTLTQQAELLEGLDDRPRAAELWTDVAHLVQDQFGDVERAIDALGHVLALVPTTDAFDHLARLHLQREEPAAAASVLRRRLEQTEAGARVPVLLRLARAQMLAGGEPEAILTLQAAFEEAPRSAEVRKLLVKLYRAHEQWEPLARTLSVSSEHITDKDTLLAYAREASDLYQDRLGLAADAVPILERAHAAFPEDRDLRARLAMGLRVEGRLDEARTMLEGLVEAFGRRRSAQRAAVHLEFARVAGAQDDQDTATDQLELASGMDPTNPAILQTLAETARDNGQLERAERAYRTLLIQARRRAAATDAVPRQDGDGRMGATEVLFELSRVAQTRGDADQAQELIESAMEALAEREHEGQHLADRLRARGEHELLQRVLEARLSTADTPRSRAGVLSELAALQADHLNLPEAALRSRLSALRADPGDPTNHEHARALAEASGDVETYVGAVETLLDKARRTTDIYVRCELLLRLAEASQLDRNDSERATELLQTAEALGVREVDVWRASARIAGARGDTATQMQYLERLAEMGEDATETRADALYRMAEVYLASDEPEQGLRTLEEALAMTPRHERACRILSRATASGDASAELLALHERVARNTEDDDAILEALERRAAHPDTPPEDVREAVALAERLGHADRADALLMRAVDLAGNLLDGAAKVAWAFVALSERRRAEGDLAGAAKWIREAVDAGFDLEGVQPLASALAEDGRAQGDLSHAVRIYEAMLQRDPTSPALWRPLADLYRELGDLERLSRLVEDTVDGVTDPDQRNALRLELARTLAASGERLEDASDVLRNILLEQPDHGEAAALLADILGRSGNEEELETFLRERLMNAQGSGDATQVLEASRALMQHQDNRGQADDATATLRGALDWAPQDATLLAELLTRLGDGDDDQETRSDLLGRLLALQTGEDAVGTAQTLAELAAARGDDEGRIAALVQGYARAPQSETLRGALEQAYEAKGDYRGLAELLVDTASGTEEAAQKSGLLRQAASIHRELLMDTDGAALLLEQAQAADPGDAGLAVELANTWASVGQTDRALELLTALADDPDLDPAQGHLVLGSRAELRNASGDLSGALADLERSYTLAPEDIAPRLIDTLERVRTAAEESEDKDTLRDATLRISALTIEWGEPERARVLLSEWVERARKDALALRMLRDLSAADELWPIAAKLSARLVAVESGEAQADAALRLAEACENMGQPGDARPGLEHARRKQPDNRDIRDRLRRIYELTGAEKELTKILAQEAEETEDEATRIELLRRVGELHVAQGETEAALQVVQQVLALAPGDPSATVTLADAHINAGDLDAADAVLVAAVEATGGKRGAEVALLHHRQARVAAGRGDAAAQLELLQQAFAADKHNGDIAAELADLAEVLEAWDVAVRVLRSITLLDGACPISRVHAFLRQGKICLQRGDRQRAVLWARKAKHEGPDDAEVLAFLGQLEEST